MSSSKFISIILIFLLSNLIFGLTVSPFIKINKEKIYLSDLINTSNQDYMRRAKNIQVTYSPDPGEEKNINGSYIRSKLQQLRVENLNDIDIPAQVVILREYQILPTSWIRDEILQEISNKYDMDKIEIDLEINEEDNIKLPIGDIDIDMTNNRLDGENLGYFNSNIKIMIDNERYDNIYMKLRIGLKKDVYVLNRDIERGELFDLEQVSKKEEIIYNSFSTKDSLTDLSQLEDQVYRNNMSKGREISLRNFERKKLFKRNEEVSIIISRGGIIIRTKARALENGYKGEMVKVRNIKSKKELIGVVLEDGTVQIK